MTNQRFIQLTERDILHSVYKLWL